jgi:ABC transporter
MSVTFTPGSQGEPSEGAGWGSRHVAVRLGPSGPAVRPDRKDDVSRLRLQGVSKIFGRTSAEALRGTEQGTDPDKLRRLGLTAVLDVPFEVDEGEIFVVMGLPGSGKSALIRMLNGLSSPRPAASRATAWTSPSCDKDLRELRRQKVSMVFQHFAPFPHRTVLENAACALEMRNVPRQQGLERARQRGRRPLGAVFAERHGPYARAGTGWTASSSRTCSRSIRRHLSPACSPGARRAPSPFRPPARTASYSA